MPGASSQPDASGRLVIRLSGDWTVNYSSKPAPAAAVGQPGVSAIAFDLTAVVAWDSSLLAWLFELKSICQARRLACDRNDDALTFT